jgi:UDP-2-acetamido-3-amino-2,3-dideoxy-glucuronate N-acetyltransferase
MKMTQTLKKTNNLFFAHSSAEISPRATIKNGVKIWNNSQIRENAKLLKGVSIGKDVYIDKNVTIEEHTRIQNSVSIYEGVSLGKWCFVGPNVTFTNDSHPRAGAREWNIVPTIVETGASIGAGSTILCGIKVGAFSMIGAGSLVTKSVPPFSLAFGVPAKVISRICACGRMKLESSAKKFNPVRKCCLSSLEKDFLSLAKKWPL